MFRIMGGSKYAYIQRIFYTLICCYFCIEKIGLYDKRKYLKTKSCCRRKGWKIFVNLLRLYSRAYRICVWYSWSNVNIDTPGLHFQLYYSSNVSKEISFWIDWAIAFPLFLFLVCSHLQKNIYLIFGEILKDPFNCCFWLINHSASLWMALKQ